MELTVARVGRAHGLRGEVLLDVRTDDPQARLAPGTALTTDRPGGAPLTVETLRSANGRWYARFAEAPDRTAVEGLRGTSLLVEVEASDEEDAWYPHELAGLRVELLDGTVVGEVVGLDELPAHDMLVVRETTGERTLVPFVHAIVPVVDVPGGRVVLDPPGGLLARDADALVVAGPEGGDDAGPDDAGPDDGEAAATEAARGDEG